MKSKLLAGGILFFSSLFIICGLISFEIWQGVFDEIASDGHAADFTFELHQRFSNYFFIIGSTLIVLAIVILFQRQNFEILTAKLSKDFTYFTSDLASSLSRSFIAISWPVGFTLIFIIGVAVGLRLWLINIPMNADPGEIAFVHLNPFSILSALQNP